MSPSWSGGDSQVSAELPVSTMAGMLDSWGTGGGGTGSDVWAVNDILLWKHPTRSLKVFASGSYFLLCLRLGLHGQLQVQPSTVLASSCFVFMGCKFLLNQYRLLALRGSPPEEREVLQQHWQQKERTLEAAVARGTEWLFRHLALSVSGVLCWATKSLSGKDPLSTLVAALALWVFIFLGESNLVSQSTLLLLSFLACFSVPVFVQRYQKIIVSILLFLVRRTVQIWGAFPHKTTALGAAGILALGAFMQSGQNYRLIYVFIAFLSLQAFASPSAAIFLPTKGRHGMLRKFVSNSVPAALRPN